MTGLERSVEDLIQQTTERLNSGGGGGTFDGMEPRVAAIEKRLDRIEPKLDAISERMARIEGEVTRLPGYPGLFAICGTLVALVGVLVKFL